MKHKTWVEISRSALHANVQAIKKLIGNVDVLAVVKGNAYGVGIEPVVTATADLVDWYGVDSLDEANAVRAYCQNPVLILGYVAPGDTAEVVTKQFSVVAYNEDIVRLLASLASPDRPAKMHIKVDTGLTRLGLPPKDTIAFAKKIARLPNVVIEGVYTHYAKLVDQDNQEMYFSQLEKFCSVVDALAKNGIHPRYIHTASSMGAVLYPETRFNMVRVGIILYGLWGRSLLAKFVQDKEPGLKLTETLTWKTTVVDVKEVPAGTAVGYGFSEMVMRDSIVVVLGAGYYDGIDKRYGNLGQVLVHGKRAKILGSITMNMCLVDVTDIEGVKMQDTAVLIGRSGQNEITAYEFAQAVNTSTYEVISRINPLIPRVLVS